MTSFRVMKLHEFEKSVFYRVACDCGAKDCDLSLIIEYDEELNYISLNMYKNLHASAHWNYGWKYFDFIRVWQNKIKMIKDILCKGYIEVQEEFLIKDENHINEFIEALEEGKEYIKKYLEKEGINIGNTKSN